MIGTSSSDAQAVDIYFTTAEQEEAVSFRLMEVSDSRILNAIEAGNELFIRGGLDDDAVICTDSATFSVRELVTSNMFLVVEKEETKGTVVGRPTTTLELSFMPRAPGIDKLKAALQAYPYNGATSEELAFSGVDELHVERLYGLIPASTTEISNFLRTQGALVIRGKFEDAVFP